MALGISGSRERKRWVGGGGKKEGGAREGVSYLRLRRGFTKTFVRSFFLGAMNK